MSDLALGIDLGGTKVMAGLVTDGGDVVAQTKVTWTARTAEALVAELAALVERTLDAHQLSSVRVGLGVAAYVDFDRQVARFAPHLPLREFALSGQLQQALGGKVQGRVVMDNDATTASLAESRWGAAHAVRNAVVITLGTGLGSGMVLDGEVRRGAHGMAGEWGHTCVQPEGRQCPCGLQGCWEQYCSGSALVWHARRRGSSHLRDGEAVAAAAAAGDLAAKAAFGDLGYWLARGLGSVTAALDPECVVIGGGLSAVADRFLGAAQDQLGSFVSGAAYRALPQLRLARFGPAAGMVGAAALALSEA